MAKPVIFSVLYNLVGINPFLQGTQKAAQATTGLTQAGAGLSIEMQKTQARLLSTQTRFSALTQEQDKLKNSTLANTAAISQSTSALLTLDQRIATTQQRMATASQAGNTRSVAGYRLQLSQLLPAQQQLRDKIAATEVVLTKEQQKFAYVTAQIAVKTARVNELNHQLDKLNVKMNTQSAKPASGFMSVIDKIKAGYGHVEKFVNAFNKVTLTMERGRRATHRVVLIVNDLSKLFTGKPLFPHSTSQNIDRMGQSADTAKTKVGGFAQAIKDAGGAGSFLSVSLATLAGNIASFVVKLGVDAVMAFGRALASIGQKAVAVVADYERSTVALKSLVAQELRTKDTTLGMNAALTQSGPIAQKLIKWIEDLAVQSPFEEKDVKQTFFLAKSYGFLVNEAKRITEATLNWAAATGKGGEEMQRVLLALGQMRSSGKIMGDDLRQLSQVGLNFKEILAKGLGITVIEVTERIKKGAINSRDAIRILTETLEKDWGEAAKDQASTLSGLLSSISDIAPRFLREFFGPMNRETGKLMGILGALQPYLKRFVEFLSSDSVLESIRGIGIQLGQLAEKAFAWGEGFVNSFTSGLRSGVKGMLGFIAQIGVILTKWLKPGSPPLVAPDLDKWGEEAAQIYFGGFASEAAAKVFFEVADKVEGILRSMSFGKEEDLALIPGIASMRKEILQVSNQIGNYGTVASNTLDSITSKLGGAAGAVRFYIQSYADLQRTGWKVAAAQENLNNVTREYDERLKGVRDQLSAIGEARQLRDEEKELKKIQRILNDPHASAARKAAASERLKEIQLQREERMLTKNRDGAIAMADARLQDAQVEQSIAQQNFAMAQIYLEAIQKQNSLFEEQASLLKQIKENSDAVSETGSLWPDEELTGFDTSGIGNISAALSDMTLGIANIKTAWSGFFDALQLRWEQIKVFVEGFMPTFQRVWQFAVDAWNLVSPQLAEGIQDSLDTITGIWGEHQVTIKGIIEFIGKALVATFLTALLIVTSTVSNALKLMEIAFHFWSLVIQGKWDEAWIYLRESLTKVINDILVGIAKWLQMIANITNTDLGEVYRTWEGVFKNAYTIVTTVLADIRRALGEFIKHPSLASFGEILKRIFGDAFSGLLGMFIFEISKLVMAMPDILKGLGDTVKYLLGSIFGSALGSVIYNNLGGVVEFVSGLGWMFFGVGWNIIKGIVDGIKGAAFLMGGALWNVVNDAINSIKRLLGIASPSKLFTKLGKTIPQGLAKGIKELSFLPKLEVQATTAGMVSGAVTPPMGAAQTAYNNNSVNTVQKNYNLNVNSNRSSQGIQQDFRVMRLTS